MSHKTCFSITPANLGFSLLKGPADQKFKYILCMLISVLIPGLWVLKHPVIEKYSFFFSIGFLYPILSHFLSFVLSIILHCLWLHLLKLLLSLSRKSISLSFLREPEFTEVPSVNSVPRRSSNGILSKPPPLPSASQKSPWLLCAVLPP